MNCQSSQGDYRLKMKGFKKDMAMKEPGKNLLKLHHYNRQGLINTKTSGGYSPKNK